ncbi:integrase catalytic domain-containing protein [Trichonephila clavipes]|nr:integrase catalytic domain-containing protein [Trichonephila clavipes]
MWSSGSRGVLRARDANGRLTLLLLVESEFDRGIVNFEREKDLRTRCKKPHTFAEELILPAAIEIVETMFVDNFAKELQSIPLSNYTVSRRIDDIAEDVEQQLFGKLRDKLFSIQLDEATHSNKDAHFIAVKTFCAKNCFCGKPHHRLIHFLKPESVALNQTVQRSVLNPLADVFGGPGGSNCVVPPQGENEENKSFVATSFLKNKTRTVLLSSVQCFLRDKYGLLHEVRALLDVGSQSHFITKDCADRLQLKNEKINLLVSCLNESTMTINGGVTTSIFNGDLSFKELNLLVVRRITDLTPSQIINVARYAKRN